MSKLNIELPPTYRKDVYIWRVRDSGDRCGRVFLAVGECSSPEEAEATAVKVRDACAAIFLNKEPV